MKLIEKDGDIIIELGRDLRPPQDQLDAIKASIQTKQPNRTVRVDDTTMVDGVKKLNPKIESRIIQLIQQEMNKSV